jgi:hypothetical protein
MQSRRLLSCLLLLLLFPLLASPGKAQTGNHSPEITLSLAQKTYSAGEPLTLHYQVRNTFTAPLYLEPLESRGHWLRVELFKDKEQLLRRDPQAAFPNQTGCVRTSLDIGKASSGVFALGPGVWTLHPGNYLLRATIRLKYVCGPLSDRISNSKEQIAEQTISLPFTVTPRAPQKLKGIAQDLQKTLLSAKGSARDEALTALFALPEEDVSSRWRSLVTLSLKADGEKDGLSVSAYEIADTLKDLGTPTAVKLLGVLWNEAHESNARKTARWNLLELYRADNTPQDVKQQIETLWKRKERCSPAEVKEEYLDYD